jgi:ribosomal protein L19E
MNNKESLKKWVILMHNNVNKLLDKKDIDEKSYDKYYNEMFSLECSEKCND